MTNWTQGPWTFEIDNGESGEWISLHIPLNWSYGYKEEQKIAIANAHLIAAAPDMYEALEMARPILSMLESGRDVADWWDERLKALDAVRAVLAKARGES